MEQPSGLPIRDPQIPSGGHHHPARELEVLREIQDPKPVRSMNPEILPKGAQIVERILTNTDGSDRSRSPSTTYYGKPPGSMQDLSAGFSRRLRREFQGCRRRKQSAFLGLNRRCGHLLLIPGSLQEFPRLHSLKLLEEL
jgi:hypothetical protein